MAKGKTQFKDGYWQDIPSPRKVLTREEIKKIFPIKRGPRIGFKHKRIERDLKAYLEWGIKRRLKAHYTDKQLRIKKIIHLLGGVKRMMKICKVTESTISKWVDREMVPMKHYQAMSDALDGKLTAGEIAKIIISK